MNYNKTQLQNGQEVFIDLDKKRTRCYQCGVFIHFGTNQNGKSVPLTEYLPNKFRLHFDDCTGSPSKTKLERNVNRQENLDNDLSNF